MFDKKKGAQKPVEKENPVNNVPENEIPENKNPENNNPENEIPVNENPPGVIVPAGAKYKDIESIFDEIENANDDDMQAMVSEYLKFSDWYEGELRSFIYNGQTTFIDDQGEVKEAVLLIDRKKKSFITGAAVLVSSLKKLASPYPVKVKYNGKRKGANGTYFDLEVSAPRNFQPFEN